MEGINMTDIIFDLEQKIKQWALKQVTIGNLGLEETGISIGERQQEAKKPEPEKVQPSFVEQELPEVSSIVWTPTSQQQQQMPPYSPRQTRTAELKQEQAERRQQYSI
jgi:hypothetical protein